MAGEYEGFYSCKHEKYRGEAIAVPVINEATQSHKIRRKFWNVKNIFHYMQDIH